jgi:hypothetical protein
VILIIKKCAFSWNNNCIIVNMHGKTTIKINICCLLVILYSCRKPKHVAVACNDTFIVHVVGVAECSGVNFRDPSTANELGSSS